MPFPRYAKAAVEIGVNLTCSEPVREAQSRQHHLLGAVRCNLGLMLGFVLAGGGGSGRAFHVEAVSDIVLSPT